MLVRTSLEVQGVTILPNFNVIRNVTSAKLPLCISKIVQKYTFLTLFTAILNLRVLNNDIK